MRPTRLIEKSANFLTFMNNLAKSTGQLDDFDGCGSNQAGAADQRRRNLGRFVSPI
jgi:hypothetical protein